MRTLRQVLSGYVMSLVVLLLGATPLLAKCGHLKLHVTPKQATFLSMTCRWDGEVAFSGPTPASIRWLFTTMATSRIPRSSRRRDDEVHTMLAELFQDDTEIKT